ncbi:MAG: hypothetical protein WAV78_38285 [Xanthobacteraceae bacterium]
MTTPASTEQLLAAWRELEAERERRFKEKLDAGEAIRVRCILDEHGDETEAQSRAIAALPEKDRSKSLGWIRRTIIRPIVEAISPPQDAPAVSIDVPASVGPREGEAKPAATAASPPHVWEPKAGVVRIQTGQPDHASPQGYCEIARWTLNARGELVLRNEDGKLLREHRLEGDQDPADMALKLLRAWASERKSDYSGRRLPHPDDAWMA